ncbi:unnamed protein product [Brachionus calyciflorus]|uniref:ShKT domain-containing protein n=1 Tax=Brachionus calyciflorus TaxID=104777 RepID=A0A814KUL5_9BILA|nr:unnamed protein product [Brachionus calyciflorus]
MLKIILILFAILSLVLCSKNNSNKTKDPCTDYPSCKLISDQMFENYCTRSTLRNMCPSHCDKKCKNSTLEASVRVLDLSSVEEEEFEEEETETTVAKTTTPTTTTSTTKKPAKNSKKKIAKIKTKVENGETTSAETTTTTTTTTTKKQKTKVTTTTTSTTTTTTKSTTESSTTTEEIDEEQSVEIEETTTTTTKQSKPKAAKSTSTKSTVLMTTTVITTTTQKVLQTESDNSATTKTLPNIPNETIYVPLYEAGFVQRVIPTSNRPECDFSRALVCKKENCSRNAVWCPMTNDVPKEQLEILFNYTTDIYMFETQGRIVTNETVSNFLFQYLNDAGVLVSHMYRTETKNSSVINKFMFEPAIRTNYIRLTPIDYVQSIALRFEVYSKGVLYNPDKEK